MPRCMALLALFVTLLCCGVAQAGQVSGDPFVAPLPLAGTWRASPGDMSPAEADGAYIDDWHPVQVPGKWKGTALQGHRGVAWYALDIRIDSRTRPANPELALLLPPFLAAYEAYLNGELIGASGQVEPLRRGPNRHSSFRVPIHLSTAAALRLRVRVAVSLHDGTFSASRPEGVALGPPDAIAELAELAARRIADLPILRNERLLRPVYIAISLLTALIFLLDRRRREFGLYALTILCSVGTAYLYYRGHVQGADWHGPATMAAQVTLTMAAMSSYFKLLAVLLELRGKLVTVVILLPFLGTPLPVSVLVAPEVFLTSPLLQPLLGSILAIAVPLAGLTLLAVGWRARRPDSRLLAGGYGAHLAVSVVAMVIQAAGERRAVGGLQAELLGLLDVAGTVAFLGTTGFVLALRYHRAFRDVQQAYEASHRFVPVRFLSMLGRKEITEVERADATEQRMAILFADIRGFTTRSEAAGAEATFELVNRYLEAIEPSIHEHEGFINKFLGDGILALFPDAASGLAGARALQRAVRRLNQQFQQEGEEPIRVGVGLHVGTVMLGTVGGKRQLDTSVIADAVNTASRVESLTKRYGVDILATATALEEGGSTEDSRELDRVVVVGRQEP
ncbi:MAG: adenylate/guanylate cyclase domain-containing protein, partial [Deltaproteobacteria bacterium]|nr:adenylate/guanylate cyclase domain-containing protein [Deltaproteobacteria bacterium]